MQGIDGRRHNEAPVLHTPPPAPVLPPPPPEFTAADTEELRFTLKELFLATTIAAVMLALFRSIGIFGALLSFLAAAGTALLLGIFSGNIARQRILFDFVWGMVMPVVCLVFDPLVFKSGEFTDEYGWFGSPGQVQVHEAAYFAWPFLGGQIATLGLVLFGGKSLRPIAPLLTGVLGAGFAVALFLAVMLALPALFGTLLFGIGLLGFTPIFTCLTYHRRMRLMWHLGQLQKTEGKFGLAAFAALGVVLCLALPLIIGYLVLAYAPPRGGGSPFWISD